MMTQHKYYRIQPAGKGIYFRSETSSGEEGQLHVFAYAWQIWDTDGQIEAYGDEVVEIICDDHDDNGDIEGVEIDPSKSTVSRRWSLREFARIFGVEDDESFDIVYDLIKNDEIEALDEIQ